MECLIGIQFKDFVLVAADMTTAQSIMVMKNGKELYMLDYFIININLNVICLLHYYFILFSNYYFNVKFIYIYNIE